jgi:hypothetical protein
MAAPPPSTLKVTRSCRLRARQRASLAAGAEPGVQYSLMYENLHIPSRTPMAFSVASSSAPWGRGGGVGRGNGLRCRWSFRRHPSGKDWRFPVKPPEDGADSAKQFVSPPGTRPCAAKVR